MAEPLTIEVQAPEPRWRDALGGSPEAFAARVLRAVGESEGAAGEIAALLGGDDLVRTLNRAHRGRDRPTNVLSFPAGQPAHGFLGDIVLAYETVAREAAEQGKGLEAHAAHLLTHGFLHILGYNHDLDHDAARMEARERAILASLGWPDPYAAESGH
jgi:probable rRNA maturation factor